MSTYRVRVCYPWVGEETALHRHADELLDGLRLQPSLMGPRVDADVEHDLIELSQLRIELEHGVVETTVSIEAYDGFDATHQVLLALLVALRPDPANRPAGDRYSSDTVLVFAQREDATRLPEPSPAPAGPGHRHTHLRRLNGHQIVITRPYPRPHQQDPGHRRAG